MELDLQRFYRLNRRFIMWIAFFVILYLLRDFFALMFLVFIFAFVMRKVARVGVHALRFSYWAAVLIPYLLVVTLLVLLMTTAVPKIYDEGLEFSRKVPNLLQTLATEIHSAAERHGLEGTLANYLQADDVGSTEPDGAEGAPGSTASQPTTRPTRSRISNEAIIDKFEDLVVGFLPGGSTSGNHRDYLPDLLVKFVKGVTGGTVTFLLAIVLSFLIVLDFDRVRHELGIWSESPVGRFFHEASASLIQFSEVVGTAFQCQLMVAGLNTIITGVGLLVLGIEPVLLLTTIVFIFGLVPVLGVWISSVPIVLIAFNDYGWERTFLAVVLITIVHLLEAYVFNPRTYASRFHLNPVIVLIILLVGHELFGVWGMLLGIPVTYYVLNIAGVPALPRRQKLKKEAAPPSSAD